MIPAPAAQAQVAERIGWMADAHRSPEFWRYLGMEKRHRGAFWGYPESALTGGEPQALHRKTELDGLWRMTVRPTKPTAAKCQSRLPFCEMEMFPDSPHVGHRMRQTGVVCCAKEGPPKRRPASVTGQRPGLTRINRWAP